MDILRNRFCRSLGIGMLVMLLGACQTADADRSATASGDSSVMLSGQQEVPPVSTSAAGTSMIRVAPDRTVSGKVTISGVNATAAHIHEAPKGSNGPAILPLTKTSDSTFVVPPGARLTEDQYASYRAGNLYVNVHSNRYPGGEIRAQLQPEKG